MRNILIALVILLISCKPDKEVKYVDVDLPPNEQPGAKKEVRYLALGDSYTIGTAIGVDNSYASQLADSLEKEGDIDTVALKIIAKNGWTTANLMSGINTEKPDSNYDILTLLIGVNNQYQNRSKEEYREQFRTLLEQSIAFAGGDTTAVFVLSIPDYGVTPSSSSNAQNIAIDIDAFNTINRQISDSLSVQYFDISTVSRTALNNSNLVASDNLHFSTKMHSLWLDIIYQDIRHSL